MGTRHKHRYAPAIHDHNRDLRKRQGRIVSITTVVVFIWFVATVIFFAVLLTGKKYNSTPDTNLPKPLEPKGETGIKVEESDDNKNFIVAAVVAPPIVAFFLLAFIRYMQENDIHMHRKRISFISWVLTILLLVAGVAINIDTDGLEGVFLIVLAVVLQLVFVLADKAYEYFETQKIFIEKQKEYVDEQKKYIGEQKVYVDEQKVYVNEQKEYGEYLKFMVDGVFKKFKRFFGNNRLTFEQWKVKKLLEG